MHQVRAIAAQGLDARFGGTMNQDENFRELARGPLSSKSRFILITEGPIGSRELRRLIEKLELDCAALGQDEAEARRRGRSTQQPGAGDQDGGQ